ncbi:unnamed protein product, partial [Clonostachys rosea]
SRSADCVQMDDADDNSRPPKRRKIRIACQQCRDKKTRCDGARPVCQACVRKKLGPEHCVYLDPSSELSDTRYVQGLETRIRELEQVARGGVLPPQGDHENVEIDEEEQPGDAMGASEGTPINSSNSLFFGPSSAAAFMKSVQESLGTGGHGAHGAEDGVSSTASRASHRRRMKLKRDMADLLDGLTIPTRRLADTLLEVYWNNIHPFYPILHKPSFMRRYNEIWSQADSSRDELHYFNGNVQTLRGFHATLNIVLALGCIHARSDAPSLKSAKTYYDRSNLLLQDADMEHGSVQLVQALVLTAQYLQSTDMANRCWITIGNAIRVAQGIGVQLDRPSESQAEREERRRTWWCCILMDRVLSMTFGRPVMIVWRTVVPKPEPIDDESLSEKPGSSSEPMELQELSMNAFFTQTLKLTDVLMLVLTNFYRPVEERRISTLSNDPISKLTLVVEVDNELARWREQLPHHLIFDPSELSGEANPIYTRQAALLHSRYLHLRILLFRPITMDLSSGVLMAAKEPQRSTDFQYMVISGCIRSCVAAVQELVNLLHIQLHGDCAPPRWYAVFYLFSAGTVLLSVLVSPDLQRAYTENLEGLLNTWSRCMEALTHYGQAGDTFANRCQRILQAALTPRSRPVYNQDAISAENKEQTQRGSNVGSMEQPSAMDEFHALLQDPDLGDAMAWPAGSQDWLNSLPEERSGVFAPNDYVTSI